MTSELPTPIVRVRTTSVATITLNEQQVGDILADYAKKHFGVDTIADIEVEFDVNSQTGSLDGAEMTYKYVREDCDGC